MKDIRKATEHLIDNLKATTGSYGLGNGGDEYRVVIDIFLYKFFNDKFGYEAKKVPGYGERLKNAEKWDEAYDKFSEDDIEDLFSYLPASTPRLKPAHTLAHLYNASTQGDFSTLLDSTLESIANLNVDNFAVITSGGSREKIFHAVTPVVTDIQKRDDFALALIRNVADFNFESVFEEKYDFFSQIFEYLIKDYNNVGGGKYAEYYTPRAIAQVMAALLVGEETDLRSVTCYDPSAGTGTLLMALAHQIGEDRCTIYSQDISNKSSEMLRLNLVLNNLSTSLPNVVQGNTLTDPAHKDDSGNLKKFDFIVSNPPFKLDFSDFRNSLAADTIRFWAGVPKIKATQKEKMEIYTCFLQHVINSLTETGRGAIVVPTGFITSKNGIEKEILKKIVDEKIIRGVVSMPSNVFATTGTNVSVLFLDRAPKKPNEKVILIDASKLGEQYKEGNNQKVRLTPTEVKKIIDTFNKRKSVEDFSMAVSYKEIKEKGYSLSAGQYFEIKIDYVEISESDFKQKMATHQKTLSTLFKESNKLEEEILENFGKLEFSKGN